MKIDIYMKSGNIITVKHVKEYKYKYNSDQIVSINFKYNWIGRLSKKGLLVTSIDLGSIEALVRK